MRSFAVLLLALAWNGALAQPYLDVVNTAGYISPDRFERYDVNTALPVTIGKRGARLVFSPGVERWNALVDSAAQQRTDILTGYALPITLLAPLVPDRWTLSITGIGRYMVIEDPARGDVQLGGAVLLNRVLRPELTLKFGAYANADAFGLFALPLLGLDWRINAKHNLFGVLPGNLIYEHKASRLFHWGAAYKAITTSFGTRDGDFRRVDENTVGLFADLYPWKRLVLRLEGGHTVISQYQGGRLDPYYPADSEDRYVDHGIGDGFYARVMLAFRVRLDEEAPPRIREDPRRVGARRDL
ncbi:MAG: hypothetical protein IPK99_16900 [Flavobacteriales bacterium]|nr:hypothetical protein [Flavobacteriales bacterium]